MEKTKKTKIKICGLFRTDDIDYANEVRPDFVGFVLADGYRRSISGRQAVQLRERLDMGIQAVGVFVNAPAQEVISYLKDDVIQLAQLHGQETKEDIQRIRSSTGKPVVKAIKVQSRGNIEPWLDSEADFLLFDSGTGSGRTFDWNLLTDVKRSYFLAGGLNLENLGQALALHPYAVDISSGVETEGFKDREKMRAVVELVRRVDTLAKRNQ